MKLYIYDSKKELLEIVGSYGEAAEFIGISISGVEGAVKRRGMTSNGYYISKTKIERNKKL